MYDSKEVLAFHVADLTVQASTTANRGTQPGLSTFLRIQPDSKISTKF